MKRVLGVAVAAAALASLLGLVIVAGAASGTSSVVTTTALTAMLSTLANEEMCVATGPVHGLSAAQASNAEAIVAASNTLSAENPRVAQIALMTAYDESGLVNLGPRAGNDGSLGLFQQRVAAGWGTAAEEMDPTAATGMFVSHLLALPGWATMPPWVAAQDVQQSGAGDLPGQAKGANYRRYWPLAGRILAGVDAAGTAADCGGGPSGGEAGPPSRHGLPVGYKIPAGTTAQAAVAIRYAVAQLGKPYVWGAAGPNAFDCSGLTMMAWAAAGVSLEHYTVSQEHEGLQVPRSAIVPGDLVLIPGSDPPGPGLPGHVGIYLGDSVVLSAVDPEVGVIVQAWSTFVGGGLDAIVDPLLPPS